MMTLEETLEKLGNRPDRVTLEAYISHAWVRPLKRGRAWHFEEIDIARIRLVRHLHEELQMGDDALDMLLDLLDQVYGLREQMRRVHHAISRQPHPVRKEILTLIQETDEEFTDV